MKSRIILVMGPKHSGKSQCVKALGKLTGIKTADLDELIESRTGKSVRALFLEDPCLFRKAEAETLADLFSSFESLCPPEPEPEKKETCLIIAAGGGLIDNGEALAIIGRFQGLGSVYSIYIDVSAETAWQRIVHTAGENELPPFLKTDTPRETHRALHERRAEAYRALAQLSIAAENKGPEEIAREIISFSV